jgi:hypothetical protein
VVAQHPVGAMVSVHYDPDKPADAVIEPGLQSDNYWMTVAPLLIIALLLFALFQQIRNRNNQPGDLSRAGS